MKITQENKNIIAIEYQKFYVSMCLYIQDTNQFILLREIYDPSDCSITKSTIYKFNIEVCLFTREMLLTRYDCLVETGIEMRLVEKCYFMRGCGILNLDNSYLGALRCLRALLRDSMLDWSNITPKQTNRIIATIGKFKIITMDLGDYLHLNYDAIKSLNLITESRHPNPTIKSIKKNNSLFDLINFTITCYGNKLLQTWLLFPLNKPELINQRREVIKYILEEKINLHLNLLLKKCKNINVNNFYKKDKKSYFKGIYDFLNSILEISKFIKKDVNKENILSCLQIIDKMIDFDQEGFIIKKGVNENLDHLKGLYEGLPSYLDIIGENIAKEYNRTLSIVYFPQVGYLIEVEGSLGDESFFRFKLENMSYYKNEVMEDLDDKLGDIQNRIYDIEIELTNYLKKIIDSLDFDMLIEFVASVDCYNSLAILAIKYDLVPAMLGEGLIKLKGVRNIFYPLNNQENDLEIVGGVIITGKNGSGKSTILKLIGSIVILNQIGSYIPIRGGELKVFDKLFTRISNQESISQDKSAFISDLYQLQEIFHFSTPDSLILIDEFGKGTNIIDGVALYLASIKRLDGLIISITHYQPFIKGLIIGEVYMMDNLFGLKQGICYYSEGLEMIKGYDYPIEFYDRCIKIKKELEDDCFIIKERDDKWAIEKINMSGII